MTRREALLQEKKRRVEKLPAYGTEKEALNAAIKAEEKEPKEFYEVWKSPKDRQYVVAGSKIYEDLVQLGYTREVSNLTIHNIAVGRIDEIEEV